MSLPFVQFVRLRDIVPTKLFIDRALNTIDRVGYHSLIINGGLSKNEWGVVNYYLSSHGVSWLIKKSIIYKAIFAYLLALTFTRSVSRNAENDDLSIYHLARIHPRNTNERARFSGSENLCHDLIWFRKSRATNVIQRGFRLVWYFIVFKLPLSFIIHRLRFFLDNHPCPFFFTVSFSRPKLSLPLRRNLFESFCRGFQALLSGRPFFFFYRHLSFFLPGSFLFSFSFAVIWSTKLDKIGKKIWIFRVSRSTSLTFHWLHWSHTNHRCFRVGPPYTIAGVL